MTPEEVVKKADSIARAGGWKWEVIRNGPYIAMIRLRHPLGSPCPLQVAANMLVNGSFSEAGRTLELTPISKFVYAADYRMFGIEEIDALRAIMLDTFEFLEGTIKV